MATTTEKKTTVRKPKTEKVDYEKLIAEMQAAHEREMKELKEQIANAQKPQIIQMSNSSEKVHFLWMAEVADDNTMEFGPGGMYGRIVGKTGSFYVPKDDLSRILDGLNRRFIDTRWLIIVSGLTEEEREAYGVNYKDGELLDRKVFDNIIGMGDKIVELYPELCEGHKEIIAKRMYEAYVSDHNSVSRETITKLNAMSEKIGAFNEILKMMNEGDVR